MCIVYDNIELPQNVLLVPFLVPASTIKHSGLSVSWHKICNKRITSFPARCPLGYLVDIYY